MGKNSINADSQIFCNFFIYQTRGNQSQHIHFALTEFFLMLNGISLNIGNPGIYVVDYLTLIFETTNRCHIIVGVQCGNQYHFLLTRQEKVEV